MPYEILETKWWQSRTYGASVEGDKMNSIKCGDCFELIKELPDKSNEEYFNIAQNRLREAWKEKHENKIVTTTSE